MNPEPDDFELDDTIRLARQDVPWKRAGYPGFHRQCAAYETKWGPYFLNKGAHAGRLFTDEDIRQHWGPGSSPMIERSFAELWDHENNHPAGAPILPSILGSVDRSITERIKDDSDEVLVQMTAQAVIQWLGTNCGRGFIQEALETARRNDERLFPDFSERQNRDKERAARYEKERLLELARQSILKDADEIIEAEVEKRVERIATTILEQRIEAERQLRLAQHDQRLADQRRLQTMGNRTVTL